MRALRDMNLPKFVFEDVPLFLGLISDLFPGLDCPRVRYPDFNDAVEQVLAENGYIVLPVQVRWCANEPTGFVWVPSLKKIKCGKTHLTFTISTIFPFFFFIAVKYT